MYAILPLLLSQNRFKDHVSLQSSIYNPEVQRNCLPMNYGISSRSGTTENYDYNVSSNLLACASLQRNNLNFEKFDKENATLLQLRSRSQKVLLFTFFYFFKRFKKGIQKVLLLTLFEGYRFLVLKQISVSSI